MFKYDELSRVEHNALDRNTAAVCQSLARRAIVSQFLR
jgi:hypothetical protein